MSQPLTPSERTCYACKFFSFTEGSPGYSEMTPGDDWGIGCSMDVWRFNGYVDDREEFARCLDKAKTCRYFEQRGPR
jgi:hypothetical protein